MVKENSKETGFHIAVSKDQIENRKDCVDIPDFFIKQTAPDFGKEKGNWHGFTNKYYPMVLIDEKTGGNVIKQKVLMQMEVHYEHDEYQPVPSFISEPVKPLKGVYWFKEVKLYVFGSVIIKFHIVGKEGSLKQNLKKSITVTVDEDGNEDPNKKKLKPKAKTECKGKDGGNEEEEEEDEIDGDDEEKPKKKKVANKKEKEKEKSKEKGKEKEKDDKGGKRRARSDSVSSMKKVSAEDAETESDEDVKPSRRKKKKGVNYLVSDEILPCPPSNGPSVPIKYRFPRYHPAATTAASSSSSGNSNKLIVHGAILNAGLPPSLVAALLDDQNRVQLNMVQFQEVKDKTTGKESIVAATVQNSETFFLNRPTVNEIFLKVSDTRVNHISDAQEIIDQLRLLFEYSFVESVLYMDEKVYLKGCLDAIIAKKQKFGDHFGASYFLRFLVLMTVLGDSFGTEQGGSSSRGTDRRSNALFVKAQQILNIALAELDADSVNYFP